MHAMVCMWLPSMDTCWKLGPYLARWGWDGGGAFKYRGRDEGNFGAGSSAHVKKLMLGVVWRYRDESSWLCYVPGPFDTWHISFWLSSVLWWCQVASPVAMLCCLGLLSWLLKQVTLLSSYSTHNQQKWLRLDSNMNLGAAQTFSP